MLRGMKPGIHPSSQLTVYMDVASNFGVLTHSTLQTNETIEWKDGKTYPLVRVDISSQSHPFWTGRSKMMDQASTLLLRHERGIRDTSNEKRLYMLIFIVYSNCTSCNCTTVSQLCFCRYQYISHFTQRTQAETSTGIMRNIII